MLNKTTHPSYDEAIDLYSAKLGPLFTEAKNVNEFEFILTILGIKDLSGQYGMDPSKTLESFFDSYSEHKKTLLKMGDLHSHISLVMYCYILEADYLYDVLKNLINIRESGGYRFVNYPDIGGTPVKPHEKIMDVIASATRTGHDLTFINDIYNGHLRNAIFHCNYTVLHNPTRIRIFNPQIGELSEENILKKLNRAHAFYEVIMHLINKFKAEYANPKQIIMVPREHIANAQKDQEAYPLIRKNHGIVGVVDTFFDNEAGRFPDNVKFSIFNLQKYEKKLFEKGIRVFPKDRTKSLNKIIDLFPHFLKSKVVKHLRRFVD